MKNFKYFILAAGMFFSASTLFSQAKDYNKLVDPYIGSGGHGHVFIGANVPFGMVQAGPDNIYKGWDWCSGYHYSDSILVGFSQNHLSGTGCSDLGDVRLMPFYGNVRTATGTQENITNSCSVYYNHSQEKVEPGYYSINMSNGIFAEMTATEHTAVHHYLYPQPDNNHILINLAEGIDTDDYGTYIKKIDDYTLEGYRFTRGWSPSRKVFFVIKCDATIASARMYNNDTYRCNDEIKTVNQVFEREKRVENGAKCVLSFNNNVKSVTAKVALSSVSCENARTNLEKESLNKDFKTVLAEAKTKWNSHLNLIDIESEDDNIKKIFYTCMYHIAMAPHTYSDANGEYRGHDDQIYTTSGKSYSCLSLWDTYRALNPLFTVIKPDMVNDLVNSMLSIYDQQGKLPIWPLNGGETECMPGYSAVPVIADAYMKGFKGFDANRALNAMVSSAKNPFQNGVKVMMEKGYIPYDVIEEGTSSALEYAADDWGISLMAKKMGKKDIYDYFCKRRNGYEQYFDKSINFIRPKHSDGSWKTPYNPFLSEDFTEGTGWQYTFFYSQCPEELIRLFGGESKVISKLDSMFIVQGDMGDVPIDVSGLIGQYAHGNEPSHSYCYFYPYFGQQWKTSEKVREVMKTMYTTSPDGLSGNEDCGQMSAWYILSSIGLYQVNPSNGVFVFGSPIVDKATFALPKGEKFTVVAKNNSDKNIYIKSVKLNGKPYNKTFITYQDIMNGGTLEFTMSNKKNTKFGKELKYRPQSAR